MTIGNVVHYGSVEKVTTEAKLSNATITPRASFPGTTVAGYPVAFALKDKFYISGKKSKNSDNSEFYEYDPKTDKWNKKSDIPIANGVYKGASNGLSYVENG